MRHHAHLIFVFLVEMGFHHVGLADLELLTFKSSSCLGLPKCLQDYRREPPRPVLEGGYYDLFSGEAGQREDSFVAICHIEGWGRVL